MGIISGQGRCWEEACWAPLAPFMLRRLTTLSSTFKLVRTMADTAQSTPGPVELSIRSKVAFSVNSFTGKGTKEEICTVAHRPFESL
jgi:hypothetical protein